MRDDSTGGDGLAPLLLVGAAVAGKAFQHMSPRRQPAGSPTKLPQSPQQPATPPPPHMRHLEHLPYTPRNLPPPILMSPRTPRDRPKGDPVKGINYIEVLSMFNDDPDTDAIIMIGEIGGNDETDAGKWAKINVKKPIVGFIAGRTAPRRTPHGPRRGDHLGWRRHRREQDQKPARQRHHDGRKPCDPG